MKKLLAVLLSIICMISCFSGIPAEAAAAKGGEVNAYLYTRKNCSMPQSGTAKTLLLLVQFPDYKNTNPAWTADALQKRYFDMADKNSLAGFYQASSFGSLNIEGQAFGWYTAKKKRASYAGVAGDIALYEEVLRYYAQKGVDFSRFDGDKDGVVDCVYMLCAGGDTGYGSDWWNYTGYLSDSSFKLNKKKFGSYVKLTTDHVRTAIHETGHALGLWDYYHTDKKGNMISGIGGHDVMDDSTGDHNALSKMILGWVTPTVVYQKDISSVVTVSLQNQKSGDCVLYFTGSEQAPSKEYYVIEYLEGANADSGGFRMLYISGQDASGKPQVSLVKPDGSLHTDGSGQKSENLFANGSIYTASAEHAGYMLFLQDAEAGEGVVCFLAEKQEEPVGQTLTCKTRTLLLKKETAYSPIVTDAKGVSVNQTLSWVSVNPKVASVNAVGKITAKSTGSTVIIGSRESKNSSVELVMVGVTVVSNLNKVSFTVSDSLTPGGKAQMSVFVGEVNLTDDLNVAWSTSNDRLSVNKTGLVKAKKVGLSTVKASLEGGILLTCQLTVDFKPVKLKVAKDSSGNAVLTWNQIAGASGYEIYRYNYTTKENPVLVATIAKNGTVSYVDKKTKKGVGYAYQVFAFDSSQKTATAIYSKPSAWKNFKRS